MTTTNFFPFLSFPSYLENNLSSLANERGPPPHSFDPTNELSLKNNLLDEDHRCLRIRDQYNKPNLAIIQLHKNLATFDALFQPLNGFATVNLQHQDESILILCSKHKYVHLKTHRASHTMHQNLAVILLQFN